MLTARAVAEMLGLSPDHTRHLWERQRCSWLHGGGHIKRDHLGRINWQCAKCGRWSDPISLEDEAAMTDAAMKERA